MKEVLNLESSFVFDTSTGEMPIEEGILVSILAVFIDSILKYAELTP